MNAATRRTAALVAVLALATSACAGRRLVDGVYHAASGYRVTVPGPSWRVEPDSRADLELRQPDEPVGMLANAVCDPAVVRRGWDVLSQHLLIGMRDRVVVESGEAPVNGRVASHQVLEGRMRQSGERVRIESYTLKGERCVYDLLYVAPPGAFDRWRGDFQRFVESFAGE